MACGLFARVLVCVYVWRGPLALRSHLCSTASTSLPAIPTHVAHFRHEVKQSYRYRGQVRFIAWLHPVARFVLLLAQDFLPRRVAFSEHFAGGPPCPGQARLPTPLWQGPLALRSWLCSSASAAACVLPFCYEATHVLHLRRKGLGHFIISGRRLGHFTTSVSFQTCFFVCQTLDAFHSEAFVRAGAETPPSTKRGVSFLTATCGCCLGM